MTQNVRKLPYCGSGAGAWLSRWGHTLRVGGRGGDPRLRRTALSLLLVGLPLPACAGKDPEPSAAFPPLPAEPPVGRGRVSQRGVPQLISLVVRDGTVTGVSDTVEVAVNTRVTLTVLADTADVLLVRGYDVRAQLTVDEPVQVNIIAARAGDAEIVLEQTGAVLTTLRVS